MIARWRLRSSPGNSLGSKPFDIHPGALGHTNGDYSARESFHAIGVWCPTNIAKLINRIFESSQRSRQQGPGTEVGGDWEFSTWYSYGHPPLSIGCGVRPCWRALALGLTLFDRFRDSVSDSCRLRKQRLFRRAVRETSPIVSMTELRASACAPFRWTPSCTSSAFSRRHWSSFSIDPRHSTPARR